MALDKWSVREKLCLASAVSCSGDQNWMTVSRSLKMLCNSNRPSDWFSQKSCAVQFGDLLENVETPKRKKRTLERDISYTAETPTESILRKFTEERVSELKAIVQEEQEEYAKLRDEIVSIQNGNVSETELMEIWTQIEQEQNQSELEKQKYAQWLKEREDRKLELQRAWKPNTYKQIPQQLNLTPVNDDMDIDETCSNSIQPGTSPLLSSLLQSTSPSPNTAITPTNVRVTAPTITNLLTGGPIITSSTGSTISQTSLLQSKPLTGPNPLETQTSVLPSPSQSAPTLSMLLETTKNDSKDVPISTKDSNEDNIKQEDDQSAEYLEPMETEGNESPSKDEEQQLMEVFKGLIPDNIDDLDEILNNNNGILNSELLEEESILEGVGSLMVDQDDELTHKIEEDSVKSPNAGSKNLEDSSAYTAKNLECINDEPEQKASTIIKEETEEEKEPQISTSANIDTLKIEKDVKIEVLPSARIEDNQTEIISSDESSDNTNLQTLKDQVKEEEAKKLSSRQEENEEVVADVHNVIEIIKDEKNESTTLEEMKDNRETDYQDDDVVVQEDAILEEKAEIQMKLTPKKSSNSESSDVIFIQTDDDSNEEKQIDDQKSGVIGFDDDKMDDNSLEIPSSSPHQDISYMKKDIIESLSSEIAFVRDATPTITIIDTDEDSCTTEIAKDESGKAKSDSKTEYEKREEDDPNKSNLLVRKLRDRDGSESPLVEDEPSDSSLARSRRRYSSTPVIDSIPSSPASVDDRDSKGWKKSILFVYNRLASSKNASIFLRPIGDEHGIRFKEIVYRPIDLPTIKRNIENGSIRTTSEFQRDVMLMCYNARMAFKRDSSNYNMAKDLTTECIQVIETIESKKDKELDREKEKEKPSTASSSSSSSSSGVKGRSGSRKSLRLP